ncbi:type I site-specific deoxyribonuclease, HsdR family [Fuerstiella marisgermanici]|uniref:Type I site-specific deoxyribonuclease, HsdR family n=1 Tax=Fuerstiella marisgermanici TaxID=1891926 RepID=A0A1P8WC37_9PLAN|nr:type I restriction enzyme endonuclease domain-containing protein [Fuerstiella marisgermanici]APZ91604.1 type I site-specific deoxyribonuclease, HsdR family [Fuerstiella marisgermanici]
MWINESCSGAELRQLLTEDHRFIFTLIKKFGHERPKGARKGWKPTGPFPLLSDRSDIIVMTDEAHRSQYDTFALYMRNALPNAAFIGFTGTPLMAGEEKTKDVFGDYVSIYNFQQSIEDGATVSLFYENRISELQLEKDNFNVELEALIEAAELDAEQEQKLEREFAREYHLITRDDRLEKVAEDVVAHFMGRKQSGKGMVICIDKVTAVKLHDKVRKYWKAYLGGLQAELAMADELVRPELQRQIDLMNQTDMAVIVSQQQNEVEDFILTKPEFDITDAEKAEVKKVARTLLQTLKEAMLVLDWRKKQRTRADVYTTVKTVLDELPRAYTPELYEQKCDTVYQHVYGSYQGEGQSIYAVG